MVLIKIHASFVLFLQTLHENIIQHFMKKSYSAMVIIMEYTFYGIQENATNIFGIKTKEISKKERKNERRLYTKTKK
jgi:hypothetical protein